MKGRVCVIGGGNAALCAALAAADGGAQVTLIERAPSAFRGGNTRHTRNIRTSHVHADAQVTGPYLEEEFLADLISVTGQDGNLDLARLAIRESQSLPRWMEEHGVSWQAPLSGTLHLSRTNRFFLGGGKALVNAYYETAERSGVEIRYATKAVDLVLVGSRCEGVVLEDARGRSTLGVDAVVVASGGFEANREWLREYWGPRADNFIVRGTPFNDGLMLRVLLDRGAMQIGNPRGVHAIAVDARSPQYDGGIVTRLDSIPFGIVVNRLAERFYDEGEDLWPKRYAIWGGLIADQPDQVAFSIFDARTAGRFIPGIYRPMVADDIRSLAEMLGLDPDRLQRTVDDFNRHAPDRDDFDLSRLDGVSTTGLTPPKSNWAQRIDSPPFSAFPLRTGVTFTYLGVAVHEAARVLVDGGASFENVYAAGEIMAGNILTRGYLAGFGLTIGSVFGRVAGREAAANA